ncbi:outer membrane protein assembly factor BamB family protein [Winogradskya humida]|uniref:Pyrrolo-quinoline quinone repeat domain-containing protein n=1 Tax=Winogradskya humida TaxID=113566 RepID=A0ABQ4A621_9ACTN|nr:PQQ-binding-like beta-propeller repeat protein [Actinoplanes humidus]GIE26281.1 hypothetical protein Ahu01nite_093830 [Actinoplanes humidus]
MTRKPLSVLTAIVLLAVAALIGWRVLRPAEVVEAAKDPYPVAQILPAGVTGKTTLAPLIVDGRLRVYAGERSIKADAPVGARLMITPRWSYRRWPAKLSGLVAIGATVVSRWDDGLLVALDGRTGKVLWKANGPVATAFTGRTGSDAVYAPPGLFTSGSTVLTLDRGQLTAWSVSDGTQRWSTTLPAGCIAGFTTVGGSFACGVGAWDVTTGKPLRSWPVGPSTPVGCEVAGSACPGLRDAAGQEWDVTAARPTTGGLHLTTDGGAVTASGTAVWRWPSQATILGVRGEHVILLADVDLVVLDARTGAQLSRFPLYVPDERVEPWKPYRWQLTGAWLALERLRPGAGTDPSEPNHFYTVDPVIIAAL